jgi:hypothetical protein
MLSHCNKLEEYCRTAQKTCSEQVLVDWLLHQLHISSYPPKEEFKYKHLKIKRQSFSN